MLLLSRNQQHEEGQLLNPTRRAMIHANALEVTIKRVHVVSLSQRSKIENTLKIKY